MGESDQKLLQQFLRHGDERAFREFVGRYAALVQQVAMRRTGKRQLAEEVSQNVFCAVVKKASGLVKHPERIPGWLHRAALFESSKVMRMESSFQRRKQLLHPDDIQETGEPGQTACALALPQLDAALDRLSDSERNLILQHYFEGKTFPQIGKLQSRPAGTVQKQCRRAVERLTSLLKKRGLVVSATAVASGLGAQLGEAASSSLVAKISTHALTQGASYSVTPLSFYMASKSKMVTGVFLAAVLIPLGIQQASIHQASLENRQLQEWDRNRRLDASMRSSPLSDRREVFALAGERKVTIEDLRLACEVARREGNFKQLEFEDLVTSLNAEELVELIPQIFRLTATQDTKRDLGRKLIGRLARLDPEDAVRVSWENNAEDVLSGNLRFEQAVYLWAEKEPEDAVVWLKEAERKVRELAMNNRNIWSEFDGVVSASLSSFILRDSPLVREVLELVPELQPQHLIQEALHGSYDIDYLRQKSDVQQAIDRVMAFLPWVREFGSEGMEQSGLNRNLMIESLIGGASFRHGEDERVFYESLAARRELSAEERALVVQQRAKEILQLHFRAANSGSNSPGWKVLVRDSKEWLGAYAPEDVEGWFNEIQNEVLEQERFQAEHFLKKLERSNEVSDSQLIRELTRRDFRLFPEFKERAASQAERIQDHERRREVLQRLGE